MDDASPYGLFKLFQLSQCHTALVNVHLRVVKCDAERTDVAIAEHASGVEYVAKELPINS